MQYTPLHLHTEYSLLDGGIRVAELCKWAKDNDIKAVAITDHGAMYGAIDFYRTAKDYGIKPIIGCEFYVFDGELSEKEAHNNKLHHLVLLAKNKTGYQNLVKLVSIAHMEGFYYKPRINHKLLEKYSDGLICLSACIQGELASLILEGNKDKALAIAKYYKSLFGEDFYIELQDHGLDKQKRSNPDLIRIADELSIKLVITNDSHYLKKQDADWHDTLLCIQTNTAKNDVNRMRFPNDEFYVKTPEQLRDSFRWMEAEVFEAAIANTVEVAEKCHLIIEMGKSHLPHFDVPKSHTTDSYLDFKVREGLEQRYGKTTPDIDKRCRYELQIIEQMGFAAYFLITWDFINYARENNIPVGPGRGSAAGSLVAYALGITDIDPIRHNLLFERFLNPERVSMPDVDIDFCIEGRAKVIDYVSNKYGADHVCQIVTFGSLAARNALKAVARVFEIPFQEANRLSGFIPTIPGTKIDDALNDGMELKTLYESDETVKKLVDMAKNIEGLKQNIGTHAAGVIISHLPLSEIVPVQPSKDGNIITEYPMGDLEKLGLLKMDFLGLRNLTIIRNALNLIEKRHGIKIEINKIALDDEKTFELLSKGDTDGVFQLESAGMKKLVRELKPTVFEDLGALVALFRPGPLDSGMVEDFVARKHGRQAVIYQHPLLEPILKDTYGTIVYQEQIMQIAQTLAGYTLGQADILRRAMGKKKTDEMAKQKAGFVQGAKANGVDEKIASELYETMEKFAAYCFNRSHSAAYAFVAYQTAYLKAHYTVEYMSALLSSVKNDQDKTQAYIAEAQKLGIKVLAPDINKSYAEFTPDEQNIRFGLNSIKGIGQAVLDFVEKERENGEFSSIADFATRLDLKCVNKKTLESFIKAGAFSSFGISRKKLLDNVENVISLAQKESKAKDLGQVSLFATAGNTGLSYNLQSFELHGDDEEFSDSQIQSFEKEFLGFYVTSHPLESIRDKLPFLTTHNISELTEMPNDKLVTVCGLLSQVKQIPTKKDPTKFIKTGIIEDLTGNIEFIAFNKTLQEYNSFINSEQKAIICGKFQKRDDDRLQIVIDTVKPVENSNIVTIELPEMSFENIVALKDTLLRYKGSDPVIFKIVQNNGTQNDKPVKVLTSSMFWVSASNDMSSELKQNFQGVKVLINSMDEPS